MTRQGPFELVNLTQHPINIRVPDGPSVDLEPTGLIARVRLEGVPAGFINGIPITDYFEARVRLPDPVEGRVCLVSRYVASHPDARGRVDLLAPDTVHAVYDPVSRRIVGVKGLARFSGARR